MRKYSIYWIIGFMLISLIGVIGLQFYWMNWSVNLQKAQFETSVHKALHNVAHSLSALDPSASFPKSVLQDHKNKSLKTIHDIQFENGILPLKFQNKYLKNGVCSCEECQKIRVKSNAEILNKLDEFFVSQMVKPLEQRFEISFLDSIIDYELRIIFIKTSYTYKVFSHSKNGFVIANGHFLVMEKDDYKIEKNTYAVDLFPKVNSASGVLLVQFPNLNIQLWKSIWRFVLMAFLFVAIIVFSFVYTIHVIYRQKMVSDMKTDFINNMTHEFKTPIATISLASDSIVNNKVINNPDRIASYITIIKSENKRMLNQVEKVLNMAKLDKRQFTLSKTEEDLHKILENALSNFELQIQIKDGKILKDFEATQFMLQVDKNHISNIIHNLLDNANKYTPENPIVTVKTWNDRNLFCLSIQDNGIGINSEAQKHIFEKFFRVSTGNVHDVKGFGLGLSYVKIIVEAHGGKVFVNSQIGHGSTFIIQLPV